MRIFTDKTTKMQCVEIPTRAQTKMQTYARTLAYVMGKPLKAVYPEMAEKFLREKPWEHGLRWRPTKGLTASIKDAVGQKEATGWMQVNMRFPVEIGNQLDRLAAEQNVSLSSLAYSMLYWWTWWVFPPASERARREAYLRRNS